MTIRRQARRKVVKTMLATSMVFTSLAAQSAVTDDVDGLTRQWLQIEAQERKLVMDWQEQEPAVKQRIELLKAEKAQLQKILSRSSDSQDDVEARRNELLAEQNALEQQQADVSGSLSSLVNQVNALYDALPPVLQAVWDKEDASLGGEDAENPSKVLQVALAKLSRLDQFDDKLTVNEEVMTTPDGKDVVVKQLYLGAQLAWFASNDGAVAGAGYPQNGEWTWQFDSDTDGQAITRAIAVFERRQQPDFVTLPLPFTPATAGGR